MPNDIQFTFSIPTTYTPTSPITGNTNFYIPTVPDAVNVFDSYDVNPSEDTEQNAPPDTPAYENSNMLDQLIDGKDKPAKKLSSDIYSEQIQQMLEKLGVKSINFKKDDFIFPRDSRQSHKVFSKLADILYEWKHNDLQIEDEV